jgi:hypothetical protein
MKERKDYLRLTNEMKAMIRKATPAQNQLPVRNQTTIAIMAAGRKKINTLAMAMIMMMPITSRTKSTMISRRSGKPKVGRGIGGAINHQFFNKPTFLGHTTLKFLTEIYDTLELSSFSDCKHLQLYFGFGKSGTHRRISHCGHIRILRLISEASYCLSNKIYCRI